MFVKVAVNVHFVQVKKWRETNDKIYKNMTHNLNKSNQTIFKRMVGRN